MMNKYKKGQMFLFAAVILIAVFFSFAIAVNSVTFRSYISGENSEAKNYQKEIGEIVIAGQFSEATQDEVLLQIADFTNLFLNQQISKNILWTIRITSNEHENCFINKLYTEDFLSSTIGFEDFNFEEYSKKTSGCIKILMISNHGKDRYVFIKSV